MNSTGGNNTFIGAGAGKNTFTGRNNIYIGSGVAPADESGYIRIFGGGQGTYIGGIDDAKVLFGAAVVCADGLGHLGTQWPNGKPCGVSGPTDDLQARQLLAAQQDVIKTQQQQIQTQEQQIADLQERVSRLESLIANK
jgi:hypothetical protein